MTRIELASRITTDSKQPVTVADCPLITTRLESIGTCCSFTIIIDILNCTMVRYRCSVAGRN